MARPRKEGLDYFPLDCNIFDDEKVLLLMAEYGDEAFSLYLRILCRIYANKGYYLQYSDDVALLLSRQSGLKKEVTQRMVKSMTLRGLFSEFIFNKYGVLTSKAIQERYFSSVIKLRSNIEIIKEYLLINADFFKENTEKITVSSALIQENEGFFEENSSKLEINSLKEKKRKEKKVKESKREENLIKEERFVGLNELSEEAKGVVDIMFLGNESEQAIQNYIDRKRGIL